MGTSELHYRPEIDGLRAFAVLSVIGFHLGVLPGGFLGVDIFFVISGYLITRLITNSYRIGKFSLSSFYHRRLRRLFPALFFVMTLTLLLSFFVLPPHALSNLGGEIIHTIFLVPNFYFWKDIFYFSEASLSKPLLHVWSLGVEEQFYFLWPLFLLFFLRKGWWKGIGTLVCFVIVLSLLGNYFVEDSMASYYLTPFRAFEICLGSLLVFFPFTLKKSWVKEVFSVFTFLLIVVPMFFLHRSIFYGLIPSVGTVVFLALGETSFVKVILSNRVATYIGKISYSMYLVHWPLIVGVFQVTHTREVSVFVQVAIVTVIISLASFMYRFVESPFRHPNPHSWSAPAFTAMSLSLSLLLLYPSIQLWNTDNWKWFYLRNNRSFLGPQETVKYTWELMLDLKGKKFSTGLTKVLIVGDSQAADFLNVLAESGGTQRLEVSTFAFEEECPLVEPPVDRQECSQYNRDLFADPRIGEADVIYIGLVWENVSLNALSNSLKTLRDRGAKRIVLILRKDQNVSSPSLLELNPTDDFAKLTTFIPDEYVKINESLRAFGNECEIFDLLQPLCRNNECRAFTDTGKPLFYDKNHFTRDGAKYVGISLLKSGAL